jgi:hypothetical protein
MKSLKLVIVGGLVFYVVMFVVGFGTGMLIHEGVLKETYRATSSFWRPELNQEPPDMAALMPRWIASGLVGAFIIAWVYSSVRSAWPGPGWKKGLFGGFVLGMIHITFALGYSGVFNLPEKVWVWWCVDTFILYLIGGAVLGAVAQKLAPE